MGVPKAWLDFGGETLLARTVRTVATVASPVVVVAAAGQDTPPLPPGVLMVRDARSDRGPLEGLAAGLDAIAPYASLAFVSSVDAPFLHPALIRRLVDLRGSDHAIAAPRTAGHVHPLGAVYSVSVRAEIAAMLAEGTLRLSALLWRVPTLFADEALLLAGAELAATDPELRSLANVNTPEEYAAAQRALIYHRPP